MLNHQSKITPTLISDNGFNSHLVRLLLAIKEIEAIYISQGDSIAYDRQIASINPYNEFPFLMHRELNLYDAKTIVEYIEERYPQKPFMPENPIGRCTERMNIHRLNKSIIDKLSQALNTSEIETKERLKKEIREEVISWLNDIKERPFFGQDGMSLTDVYFSIILWKLHVLGVEFNEEQHTHIIRYREKLLDNDLFKGTLTELDKDYL